jgi:hypothetical protein
LRICDSNLCVRDAKTLANNTFLAKLRALRQAVTRSLCERHG